MFSKFPTVPSTSGVMKSNSEDNGVIKRSVEDIIGDIGPSKSKKLYEKEQQNFRDFCQKTTQPLEDDYLQYFDFLGRVKKFQASTLWTKYSMLNSASHLNYGKKLQDYPRITALLKTFNKEYVPKQASVFKLNEIHTFLRKPLTSCTWILRKAVCVVSFCGGLRSNEMVKLKYSDVTETEDGYKIQIERAKQNSMQQHQIILVPRNLNDVTICMASHLSNYITCVKPILDSDPNGRLWKGCNGGRGFVRANCGHNVLHDVGKDVAKELGIEKWNTYTGHCWRRTAATESANNGATSVQMKKNFHWNSDVMPLRYVNNTDRSAKDMAALITGHPITSTAPSTSPVMNLNSEDNGSNKRSVDVDLSSHSIVRSRSGMDQLPTVGYVDEYGTFTEVGHYYQSIEQTRNLEYQENNSASKIITVNMGDNSTLNIS